MVDPLSIAASAIGLACTFAKLAPSLYTTISDTQNVDTNVSGLCDEIRSLSGTLDGIGKTIKPNPMIDALGLDQNNEIWLNFKVTLGDCQATSEKLHKKLEELQNGTLRGFSILRHPVKQIKFSMNRKEIKVYQQRIHHINGTMQLSLQMISMLRKQVGRVGNGLPLLRDSQISANDLQDENNRVFQNLMRFVHQADDFQSKASSIAGTMYGGSVPGDPLSEDQWESIEAWIPNPVMEEPSLQTQKRNRSRYAPTLSSTTQTIAAPRSPSNFTIDATVVESASDSDSEIERKVTNRTRKVVLQSVPSKDHDKAERPVGRFSNRQTSRKTTSPGKKVYTYTVPENKKDIVAANPPALPARPKIVAENAGSSQQRPRHNEKDDRLRCRACKHQFQSRNVLFDHLEISEHDGGDTRRHRARNNTSQPSSQPSNNGLSYRLVKNRNNENDSIQCWTCNHRFQSREKLFDHLEISEHDGGDTKRYRTRKYLMVIQKCLPPSSSREYI